MNLTPEELMAILHWYHSAEEEGFATNKGMFFHDKGMITWDIDEDDLINRLRLELDRQLDLVDPA